MMDYEKQIKKIEKQNQTILTEFEKSLKDAGLSAVTISKHVENAEFYINEFLLYGDDLFTAAEGCAYLDSFFGYFFIRKCMWSTPGNIKTTAASLKKFYKFMYDKGYIDEADYAFVCAEIKENMTEWQDECARYNDPDEDFW